jgi:type VI secretion system protein ImpL
MSQLGSELRSVFGVAGVVSVYGVASLLILYIGPQYGYGIAYQLLVIGLILLTLPVGLVIQRRRRKKRQHAADPEPEAAADEKAKGAHARTASAPARTYDELTRGAEEVVQWLRGTKLGAGDSKRADPAEAVYALPWFLVAGPRLSGKTSLVLSSKLHFKSLPSQLRAEHRLVTPTRGCEWRVTDEAVFLDTAGRYQIADDNEDEWAALVETVKHYRGRRALDGVVIVVSAAWAVAATEDELEQQAETLRTRLNEVLRRTGVQLPVYLVWTHVDEVEGFGQFFSQPSHAEVWGATLPLELAQSERAHALFDVEFDALYDALTRQRLARLSLAERPADQLGVFNFPSQLDETRNALALFTTLLFRPDPVYRDDPMLRGFYFTANVNGARVGRAAVAPAQERAGVSTRTVGEGYFAEPFFKNVLLRDKDLAAALQPPVNRPYRWRLALLIVGVLVGATLLAGLWISFDENQALLANALKRASNVEERMRLNVSRASSAQDSPEARGRDTDTEARVDIEALEGLRETVATLDEYERNGAPLRLRFGLYAGGRINPQVRAVYFEALTQRYFKQTLSAVERDLEAFGSGKQPTAAPAAAQQQPQAEGSDAPAVNDEEAILGRHYDLLKAYLMLTSEPARVEPAFLAAQLADYWRAASPPDMENVSRQQLEFYAQQANRPGAPRAKADDKIVAQARARLTSYPAVNRYYKRVTAEINARTHPVTLGSILGGRGGGVLSSNYTVPGSYTLEGFREQVSPAFKSAAEEMSKDDWVMGPTKQEGGASAADTAKLWSLYFRDYTEHWRSFLRATSVNRYGGKDDAVNALKALTATDSPLELVVESVARNTDLSARQNVGFFARLKGIFSSGSAFDTEGNSEVEREFRPLIDFANTAQNKDATAVSQYRSALLLVLDPLENASQDQLAQVTSVMLTNKDELNLQQSTQKVNRLLDGFQTAAGRNAAVLLKQPLANLRGMLYGEGYQQIEREWRDQIYPAARRLEAGYPFTASASRETPVDDLSRFLNPVDGQLTNFFKTRLATSFDDVQGQWRLKETGAYKFSDAFVNYLNSARRLREALFTEEKQQPSIKYDVTLQPVPNADARLEIDGQPLSVPSGASAASGHFEFPAKIGGGSGVRVVINAEGQTHDKPFNGAWGLFRFVQAAGCSAGADNACTLSPGVDGLPVRATLRPAGPFDRKLFSDLRAPESLGQ